MKTIAPVLCSLIAIGGIACSSELAPRAGVTVLVTNATCQSGRCDSLRILGFPSNQPNTPGGYWSLELGIITTPQECFILPETAEFLVIGQRAGGGADTSRYEWSTARPLSLGAIPTSMSTIQAGPSTRAFVPATQAAWQVALPGDSLPSASGVCAP